MIRNNISLRLLVCLGAISLPIFLLSKGIYGSFLFSFSVPFLWQVGIRGEPINTLGLSKRHTKSSIISGIISGCLLGLLGGKLLQLLGLTNWSFIQTNSLKLSVGKFGVEFPLMKELGYQLLTKSNSFEGLTIYLVFSIFIIGFGEEIFWRGFILRKISNKFKQNLAILITSLLFALSHFYIFAILPIGAGIILLLLIGLAGMIWGYLFVKTGNIWSVALSHGIVAFIIWKYYFFTIVVN